MTKKYDIKAIIAFACTILFYLLLFLPTVQTSVPNVGTMGWDYIYINMFKALRGVKVDHVGTYLTIFIISSLLTLGLYVLRIMLIKVEDRIKKLYIEASLSLLRLIALITFVIMCTSTNQAWYTLLNDSFLSSGGWSALIFIVVGFVIGLIITIDFYKNNDALKQKIKQQKEDKAAAKKASLESDYLD